MKRPYPLVGVAVAVLLVTGSWSWATWGDPPAAVVVGVPTDTSTSTAAPVVPAPPRQAAPTPAAVALVQAAGRPWPAAVPFDSTIPVPDHLAFVLVIGSDARPGQDPSSARADSIHLLAANPRSGEGTILGFPRDSWVEVPGHGRRKINDALALGGPDLLAQTVHTLTGLPVDAYVLTGFEGFERLVDDLGGVDVPVPYRMADRASGANFEAGWHRMGGAAALAFARNRKDTPHGDLSRSANHGLLVLSALAKMRGEVGDDAGIHRWIAVLVRHVRLDLPVEALPPLAALGRRLDPDRVTNIVVPGTPGRVAGRSVVLLDASRATALFEDLRADAVVGAASPTTASTTTTAPPTTSTSSTTTTSTTTSTTSTSSTTTSTAPPTPTTTPTTTA